MVKLAFALDLCLSNRDDKVLGESLGRNVELNTIPELVLQTDNGVGVTDGSLQEPLGVLGIPWGDHLYVNKRVKYERKTRNPQDRNAKMTMPKEEEEEEEDFNVAKSCHS